MTKHQVRVYLAKIIFITYIILNPIMGVSGVNGALDGRPALRQHRLGLITPGLNTFVCECTILFLRSYTGQIHVPLDISLYVHFPGRGIFTEISFMAHPGRQPTYYIRVGRYEGILGTTHPREHIQDNQV